MSLVQLVEEVFGSQSRLSDYVPEFHGRAGQTRMALKVAQTIQNGGVLVVEAGTGVGKTYSYLVPALLSGKRILVSTATKNLQDQLFGRDLPLLVKALGLPVKAALLKGRASYLCLHRIELAHQTIADSDRASQRALAKIEKWAHATRSGDLAELPGLDERSPIIPLVTSTRENCLGSQCPKFRACHVNIARREAMAADVVVINHHLFFADLAVRESGMAEILPTVNTVIFDEAHQINETGVQFLGQFLSTSQILDFASDYLSTGLTLARGLGNWQELAASVELAARELRLAAGQQFPGTKVRWTSAAPDGIHEAVWAAALGKLAEALGAALVALDTVTEVAPDFARLAERIKALGARIDLFSQPCAAGSVRWLDAGTQLRLVQSPLDIAEVVKSRLLSPGQAENTETAQDIHAEAKAWIFTSATLGDDAKLTWFTEPCGLAAAEILKVDSPFDYPNQASVYVPKVFPKPSDPGHSARVAELVAEAAGMISGRTLVLTTTLRALRAIAEGLQAHFRESGQVEVLAQGQRPKRELMDRFREGASHGQRGCVLVASASFWEGFDVPGDALQLVVIDKLPFPPPNDPLVEARSNRLELSGRSAFKDYFLPEAAVALKQGAGRLIRRESDRGVLVVCDNRMATMSYGRRLFAALPPMRALATEEEFLQAVRDLAAPATTRISTTAQTQF
jgi:ATP-dependent DNA helicase DinG